jgi:hypothetical protein
MEKDFCGEALAQMGCAALEALLRSAPPARDREELRLRNACWAEVARRCPVEV